MVSGLLQCVVNENQSRSRSVLISIYLRMHCLEAGLFLRMSSPQDLEVFSGLGPQATAALPAWRRGSAAVKCHFAVADRGSKVLRGLTHGSGEKWNTSHS